MPFAERAGTSIFYTAYGDGPPTVLLHGWCGDGSDWCYQWPALAHDYRVVVPDLRGHGASSTAADGDYSPRAAARDAVEVMDACGAQRAVVAGHSLGFVVAPGESGGCSRRRPKPSSAHSAASRGEMIACCTASIPGRCWSRWLCRFLRSGRKPARPRGSAIGCNTPGRECWTGRDRATSCTRNGRRS